MRRTRQVDMSPEAIARRLWEVGELYRLGRSIRSARRVGPIEAPAAVTPGASEERTADWALPAPSK